MFRVFIMLFCIAIIGFVYIILNMTLPQLVLMVTIGGFIDGLFKEHTMEDIV